jgi:hypothetical protein
VIYSENKSCAEYTYILGRKQKMQLNLIKIIFTSVNTKGNMLTQPLKVGHGTKPKPVSILDRII